MGFPVGTLKQWFKQASKEQKQELACIAGTSVGHLYQISSGNRIASTELAGRIEQASGTLHRVHGLPRLYRYDLSPSCAVCPYAKRCK